MRTDRLHQKTGAAASPCAHSMLVLFALLFAAQAPLPALAATTRLVVLPLNGEGTLSAQDLQVISEQLAVRIANTGSVTVVEPSLVAAALKELNVGAKCNTACAIAVGARLDAVYVFAGSLQSTAMAASIGGMLISVANGVERQMQFSGGASVAELIKTVSLLATSIGGATASETPAVDQDSVRTVQYARRTVRSSGLSITTQPPGAQVTLNGSPVGETPYADSLIPGTYNLAVSAKDYYGHTSTVTLASGKRKVLKIALLPRSGGLVVESTPAGAAITVNGSVRGTTPRAEARVPPGQYRIGLSLPAFLDTSLLTTVHAGTTDTVHVGLWSRDSIAAVLSARHHKRQVARRIVFGTLAGGLLLGGLLANADVGTHVDAMDEARSGYESPGLSVSDYQQYFDAYQRERANAEDSRVARNWLYGVGGVFTVAFTISIWF